MSGDKTPYKPGGEAAGKMGGTSEGVGDLETRREALNAALAERKPAGLDGGPNRATGGGAGFANALKLSSEFIAGVLVGAGLGYLIDRFAGTAPWGMIVFLLLGFAAGVLNVLRSVGVVAEPENRTGSGGTPGGEQH